MSRRISAAIALVLALIAAPLAAFGDTAVPVPASEREDDPTYTYSKTEYGDEEHNNKPQFVFTVFWNDPVAGQPLSVHCEAAGGSGVYKFYQWSVTYIDPVYGREIISDPTKQHYTGEVKSYDYQFTPAATGTYELKFSSMDMSEPVEIVDVKIRIQIDDPNYPSVSQRVKDAVRRCDAETDGSEYSRALWLHDWLIQQLDYDHTFLWSSAESALCRGTGTCQSYTDAYSILLTEAGIANHETQDVADAHTWNAVKIDGEWCQVDCTWDDTKDTWSPIDMTHFYFGLTDELMGRAHPNFHTVYEAPDYATPSKSLKNNYYVRDGEADDWADTYVDQIKTHLNNRETSFEIPAKSTLTSYEKTIQTAITAYALNQRTWSVSDGAVKLTVTSDDTMLKFKATYPQKPVEPEKPPKPVEPDTPSKPVEPEKPSKPADPQKPSNSVQGWKRLWGQTALDTMVAISKTGWTKSDVVVIATTKGHWDALAASPLAGVLDCPILLTNSSELSPQTKNEIKRLGARKAYVCGGPVAIASRVDGQLRAIGCSDVQRVYGAHQQETAVEIAKLVMRIKPSSSCIVVTSKSFHDALSIGPYAYAKGVPIVTCNDGSNTLPKDAAAFIRNNKLGSGLIVGGPVAVNSSVDGSLRSNGVRNVERVYGATAYETSVAVARWQLRHGMTLNAPGVATGKTYYDALVGAALCGHNNSVLVITSSSNRVALTDFIASNRKNIPGGYVFGGPVAVSDSEYQTLLACWNGKKLAQMRMTIN